MGLRRAERAVGDAFPPITPNHQRRTLLSHRSRQINEGGLRHAGNPDLTIKRLFFFEEYVRDAFNPVGVMLDFWAEQLPPCSHPTVKVYVINDLYTDWSGKVRLKLLSAGKTVAIEEQAATVASLGQNVLEFARPASRNRSEPRMR